MRINKKYDFRVILREYTVILVFIILVIISSILSDSFLKWMNIINTLRTYTPEMLVSLGMLFVILTGGIDLSVGAVACLGNCMVASLLRDTLDHNTEFSMILAILLVLLAGAVAGSISGFLVSYLKMAPFVVTLAMISIARGAAAMVTNGEPVRIEVTWNSGFLINSFGQNNIPGIEVPWPVLLGIIIVVLFVYISKYTTFGRLTIATGSNENAVHLAGISVAKYKFLVYMISGMLASFAGVLIAARSSVGVPTSGQNYELDAIAACVIGGASLNGGKGKVLNTVFGLLILAMISNIMILMSVPAYPQEIMKGVIIIVAVLLQGIKL